MLLSEIKIDRIIFKNNIVYRLKNFNNNFLSKKKYYNFIVNEFLQKKITQPKNAFNVRLSNNEFFEIIYFKFVFCCLNLFKSIKILSEMNPVVWAYINNKNTFETAIHNHSKTSTINGVYYFNVPKSDSKLLFYDKNLQYIGEIQPSTGDLLIFSCELNHKPLQSYTEEYRIALNLEITCDNDVLNNFYTKD